MSIVKRFNALKGLDKIDVLVDDFNTSRHIVISDMPESLPQGKSSFLIETGPFMKGGIELQIDFIDSSGNSIYIEPIQDYLEGTSRRVSVEVYSDTAPGVANIVLVGELDSLPMEPGLFSDVEAIPSEWDGIYNIRLTKEVIINPVAVNTQPIKFYTQPTVTVTEKRLGTLVQTAVTGSVTASMSDVGGRPASGFEYTSYDIEDPKQGALAEKDQRIKQSKGKTSKIYEMGNKLQNKKGRRKNSIYKRVGHVARSASPIEYPYSIITDSNQEFTTKDIGANLIVTSVDQPQDDTTFLESGLTLPLSVSSFSHWTGSIVELENNTVAYVDKPITLKSRLGEDIIIPFTGNLKLIKDAEPTSSYSLQNIISYADVTLGNMRTFSGDVFKAKVLVKSEGSFDDFKTLADIPVESSELLIDPFSIGMGLRTGYFEGQADVTSYWDKFGGVNGLSTSATETVTYDNATLLDGIYLSGSISPPANQLRLQTKDTYSFNLTAGVDYTISFNAYAKKGNDNNATALIYISGSSVYQNDTPYIDPQTQNLITEPSQYGKRLGSLELTDHTEKDYGLVTQTFTSDVNGAAVVQFRILAGSWYISDLSVKPAQDTGFSPSSFTFQKEMPAEFQHKRPDTFEFIVEFYDSNENIADSLAFSTGSVFTGANLVITGTDNIQSGDMFLGGDTTGSGIHFGGVDSILPETGQSGADGSGFIRSIGYQGFVSASAQSGSYGFMIYSGSVLPDSGENYKGVGLELVGASGSFKFRTNPSVFDVQADSFFVGKTATQFISGSGGNVEISSSNFHLTPEGNVTMSGTITADAGYIGDWKIVDGKLSGSNATLDAVGAALYHTQKGPGTDTSAAFDQLRDEYYVDFTPNQGATANAGKYYVKFGPNFSVSSSGVLFASGAKFEGTITASAGQIGGWQIEETYMRSIPDGVRLYGGGTPYVISSSNFQVTSDGDVSGSQVLFTGGKIGGYEISSTEIKSSNENLRLKASGQITGSTVLFTGGKIAGFDISGTKLQQGTSFYLDGDNSSTYFISSSNLQITPTGDISGSQVSFTGGTIGGFNLGTSSIQNVENTVELSSLLPGLAIKDAAGVARVQVKSGSLSTVGGGTQYIENKSFEDDSISAGRNFVSTITSWSFVEGGASNVSLTDRSGYANDDKAVSGDVTIDIVVPAGSGNYSSVNTYELSQVMTASISKGDTLSFSSVARFSSSFGGKGKDRALGPQYFRAEYSASGGGGWIPFLPTAKYTASNGYGEYFLGSGQYSSFGASAELPAAAEYVKLVLTGSINDDTGFSIKKPLYVGDKGTVDASLSGKTFTKKVVGSTTADYPETEITFDNFSVRSNTRKVELSEEGILIYNSEDSFFKMDAAGIEYRGGSGVSSFGSSISRESFTNDSQVAGTLGAPSLQAYVADPEAIGTTASDGNVGDYAKGNHIHTIAGSTINSAISGITLSNGIWNSTFGTTAGSTISGSHTSLSASLASRITAEESDFTAAGISGSLGANATLIRSLTAATVSGSWTAARLPANSVSSSAQIAANISGSLGTNATLIRSLTAASISGSTVTQSFSDGTATMISGSKVSTGSFGKLFQDGLPIEAATGTNTGDVTLAGGRDYITISGQEITRNVIDISDDTNLVGGTGITLTGDTLSTTDSEIVHDSLSGFVANEHIDHSAVSISAGGILSGGGTIAANRTITLASSDVVHDSTTGFVANEHIDHSAVSISAGGILSGGGTIASNRTITLASSDVVHDSTTGFVANEHIDHSAVSISAGGILSGGGTIASNRTITLASSDVVHDSTTGFVANEHIDHSGVTLTAGTGLTGGGTIASNRTFAIDFSDSTFQSAVSGAYQGDGVFSGSAQIDHDATTNFAANEHFTQASITTVGTIGTGVWQGTDVGVAYGGTGASTLNNLIALGTHTTGNYVGTLTGGTGITSTGNTSGEGIAHSISVDASQTQITGVGTITTGVWQGTTVAVNQGGTGVTTKTGTGNVVLSSSPTLVTPALGTPASGVATNITGLPISSGVSGLASNVATFLGTPSSANLRSAVTDETGTGVLVFATSPTLVTPVLGTPASGTATNITGLPIVAGTTGTLSVARGGTGATALTNLIALGTHSTGNYVGTLTGGTGITSTGATTGEGIAHSISVDASQTQITGIGTITTGVWNGTVIASAYLDADTAHLTTTQTFSGAKTFSSTLNTAAITATGNISGSVSSTGSFGRIQVPQTKYLEFLSGGAGTTEKWTIFNNASNEFEIKSSAYGGSPIRIDATGGGVNVHANLDVGAGVDVTGNITVTGTVDGRDVATDGTKLDGIEASADVTDTTNVTAAGALMDSEVDADIKSLSLPASTTITTFGASLVDDAAATNARTTLGLVIGTDVQAYDTQLTSVAGWTAAQTTTIGNIGTITTAANKMIYTTAADTFAETALTSTARTLLDDSSTAVMRTTLGVNNAYQGVGFASSTGILTMTEIDGGTDTVDLGIGTGDSPTFVGLTLTGNLSVAGTMTTTTTNEVVLGDQILTLNGGSSAGDGGIYVNDAATTQTGSLLWDVSADRWIGGLKDSEINLVTISSTDTLTNKTLTSPDINTPDIDGGNIDGATIATSDITVGSGKTLNVSAGTLTLAANQISGDKVEGGTIAATTITALTTAGITATANIDIGNYDFRANTLFADDLTSGRVPFAAANGQLVDDSDFTFATDTLTVTKIGAYEQAGAVNFSDEQMTNVNIDSGTITGITDLAVADGGTGLSTVATSNILTGNGTGALTAESTLTFDGSTLAVGGDITFSDTNTIGTSTFVSGITGDGFRVQDNGSSGTLLEVDNVVVRNTLRTHIFQKDVVKATNGILFVSDSGVISGSNGSNSITFVDAKSATFSNNQQLWYKDIDEDTGNIVSVKFSINGSADTSVSGMSTYAIDGIIPSGAAPYLTGSMGGTAVRISGGSLVLDASSNNSPYMDVNSGGSGSAVVRTGNLAGITSPKFGALTGEYGLWASGSAYLEGSINATSGEIGGWTIGTNLSATNMRLNPSDSIELGTATTYALGNGIFLGNDGTARFGNAAAARFQWDLTNVEIYNSSNQKLVSLGGTNEIVGWELVPGRFQYDSSAGSIALDATSQQISIHTGSINTAKPKVVMGKLPRVGGSDDDDRYGFAVFSGTDNASILDDTTYSVLITKDKARLAGWDLIPGNIQSDNTGGSVRLSSISQSLTIWTGSMDEAQPKLVLGKLPLHDGTVDSPYGFAVFSGSGVVSGSQASASVLITANKARLAGWELGPGQLTSGTVATIDGNQAKIALGTNATTHTGMSPSASLFFVSASADPIFFVGENFSYVGDVLKAGGWTIGDGVITGGNATLAAAGYLSLGTGTAGYANSTTRIYIDGVNQRMSIGTGFKYTGGSLTIDGNATIGGWTIGSTLSATNILLDPATPKITLGSKATLTDSNTGLYLGTDGLALGASSVFKVTAAGALTATSATITGAITATSGEIGGLTVSSDKLYVGTGTHNNSNTAFYVEDDGKFSLKDKLVWDGSDLSIQGSITITGGSGFATAASVSGSFDDKGSAAGAVTASAADATTKANAAQSAAASDATTKANAAEAAASASAAVGTAAAQAAIDTMETQLVLDSGGMGLWSSGGVASGFLVADYGTTTKFYDGVDDLAANVKLQLNASGITAYGDNTTTYATFDSSGMTIVDNSVTAGTFTSGTVTLYGASSNDRVVINNTGMSVYTANVLKATALDAGFTAYGDDVNTYATVTSTGLTIFEDSTNMANFGSTVRVGRDETDKSALRVAADGSMSIGVKDGTPKFSVTAAGVVSIEGSMTITGGTGFATPASVSGSFDDKGSAAGAVTASAADATTKANAAQSAAISTAASDATTKADAAETAASASAAVGTAAAQLAIDTMETQVVLDSNGMGLWNAAGTVQVSEYGTTSTFWDGVGHADTNRKLELNASGITLWGGAAAGNDYLNLAAGSLSMYSNNVRTLHITDHGINIGKSATGPSGDGTPSAVIGNISLHSGGARIYGDTTTTYAEVTSAGLSVYEDTLGSATSMANFGSTMRIGVNATDKSALRVAADGTLTIGTSSTTNVTISSAGALTITGEVNASSGTFSGGLTLSGNLTAGGAKFGTNVASTNDGLYLTSTNHWYDSGVLTTDNILATGGSVGGWELEANTLKSSYSSKNSLNAISSSFEAGSASSRVTRLSISSIPIPTPPFTIGPQTRFDLSMDDANFKHSASYVESVSALGKNARYELDVGEEISGSQIYLEIADSGGGGINESIKIAALADTGSFLKIYARNSESHRWLMMGSGSFAGTDGVPGAGKGHGIILDNESWISGSLEGSASFGTVMTNTIQTTPKPNSYYNDNLRILTNRGKEYMRFHCDAETLGAITINSGSHGSVGAPYLDFRVLSATNDNMLFVDGVNSEVGIGTGDPGYTLDVAGDIRATDDMFVNDDLTVSGIATITEKITSTAGITFGSDTADANVLHDYEEGDWTPTLNVSGTVTTSYGCHYVKIGSLVTCWMKLSNIQESGTQSADFIITGLPFTVEFSCTGGNMMANGFDFADDPDNVNNLTLHVTTSEEVKIYETKDASAAWDAVTWGDITDNDDIYGQFTYRTTQ